MSKAAELAKAGETLTNQPSGRKNLVTNGAMQVAQRSASVTGLGAASGYHTLDRFSVDIGATASAGRYTMTQTADGPSGFANCLKLDCTTADTSIAAGEALFIQQRFEGQDLQQLKKGTSDAESVTVSFYVKGDQAATYTCELFDHDNSRAIAQSFAVTTDWNRIELTFAADTTDPLNDDNALSFELAFWLHGGSTYTGGTFSSNAWKDNVQNTRLSDSQTSFFDSTDREFFITGVQLEIGSQATNFEHRSFGEELALCQRYCQRFPAQDQADAGDFSFMCMGYNATTTEQEASFPLPVTMRIEPTGTFSGNWRVLHAATATAVSSGPVLTDAGCTNSALLISSTVGSTALTVGQASGLGQNDDVDAHLILTAEL